MFLKLCADVYILLQDGQMSLLGPDLAQHDGLHEHKQHFHPR